MTLSQAMHASIVMPLLVFLSVLVLAQALERLYVFWVTEKLPTAMWERVREKLEEGDRTGAMGVCRKNKGTLAAAILRLLALQHPKADQLADSYQFFRAKLQMDLSRRVGFFGTISFIAPLIGLMGTVMGIMRAFHDLAAAGAGGPAVVAAGISEALVTTAAGIGLAVFSSVLYNYFIMTVRHRLSSADLWVYELQHLLAELK